MTKRFYCPRVECGQTVTAEQIWSRVPPEYRPQANPIVEAAQQLMDYEIIGIIREDGELQIEYPRRRDNSG